MDPESKVQLYVEVSSKNPNAGLDELAEIIRARGVNAEETECLLAFVPMAFAHVLLSPPVRVAEGFELRNTETGRAARGVLKDEVFYSIAIAMARDLLSADEHSRRLVLAVASASAELDAVNRMVKGGSDIANIVLTEPVLFRIPTEHLAKRQKPWWQLWK